MKKTHKINMQVIVVSTFIIVIIGILLIARACDGSNYAERISEHMSEHEYEYEYEYEYDTTDEITSTEDENEDITITTIGISLDEASQLGGMHVLHADDSFTPLQEINRLSVNGNREHICYTRDDGNVTLLTENESLAIFSDELSDAHAYSVIHDGFTVPIAFNDDCVYQYEMLPEDGYLTPGDELEHIMYEFSNDLSGYGLWKSLELESVNGINYYEFYQNNCYNTEECCPDSFTCNNCFSLADMQKGQNITIGYYSGTQYIERIIPAECHYFCINDCSNEFSTLPYELTHSGYAIIDISSLSSGTYIIEFNDQEYVFEIE